jgi:HEAT repeat protein
MPDHSTQHAPDTEPGAGPATAEESPIAAFLLKLVKAMKGAQFYPENHPAFAIFLEKCHAAVAPLVSQHRALVFETKSQRIHFAGKPVAADLIELRHLAMECVYRRVKKFHIQDGVEARELEGFIRALTTDPDVVQAAGGIEKVLFAKGIKNIWANEVNYQDLLYGDQAPEQAEEMFAPEEEGEGPGEPEEDPLSLPEDATPRLEELVKLLQNLHAATDVREYGELTASLVQLMQGADPPFEKDDTYRALRLLSAHASGREDREASLVPHALWAIRELTTPEIHPLLLERLMAPGGQAAGRLMALFWQIGASVLPPLVEELVVAKTIQARRVLATVISGFGDEALPHLLNMLNDQRWFVIRNVVAILGEIGDPSAINSLEPLAAYPDPRIAKEALRAIGKIRSPESRTILERFLVHATGDLQLLAAFALGVLRDPNAVPALTSMLPRRVVFTNLDLQREVIKALVKIRAPEAVPALARVFRRRSMLAPKRNEELRVMATQALACINDEAARSLLVRGVDSSNKTVAQICRKVVYARTDA